MQYLELKFGALIVGLLTREWLTRTRASRLAFACEIKTNFCKQDLFPSIQLYTPSSLLTMPSPAHSKRNFVLWLLRIIGYTSISVALVSLFMSWYRQYRRRLPRDGSRPNGGANGLRRTSSTMNNIQVTVESFRIYCSANAIIY